MLETLIEVDKQFFLFFNSRHADWLDPLMIALSSYVLWGCVFVLFAVLIFANSKKHKIITVVFYGGSVTMSTVLTNVLKLVIQRPRPIHEELWKGFIHDIERYSAAFSFFSSHAATTFCIATFVFLFFRTKKLYGFMAFLWATAVSYSRIYVGKHYPFDVLVGVLFGMLMGYIGYFLLMRYIEKKDKLAV